MCFAAWSRVSGVELDVENLYRQFGAVVLRRCRALLRHEGQAVLATQATFVMVLQERGWLAHPAPTALVLKLATLVCLRQVPQDPHCAFAQIARVPAPSRWARLILGGTWDDLRVAAVLHLVDGLSLAEAAREAGVCAKRLRRFVDFVGLAGCDGLIRVTGEREVVVAQAS